MEAYSVLMCVYHKENPEHLATAIESILGQSVVTDDFVIVCDGGLTPQLERVLDDYSSRYPQLFHIVRLPHNVGVGLAAREGLPLCKNEYVAKMDSDDISLPLRCERQLARFAQNPELTVLGGYIEEFDAASGQAFAVRKVPLDHAGICKYARRRSPFNNVSVMYKKSAVLAVGSYRDLCRGEDYDLFVRLLIAGFYAENMDETLVRVRVDTNTHRKRSALAVLKGCSSIWWNSYKSGFSSLLDLMICVCGGLFLFLCPNKLQQLLYACFLREKVDSESSQ